MSDQASLNSTFSAALAMYRRLRQHGQTRPLARISVEARYSSLTSLQRRLLRQMIAHTEAGATSPHTSS